jgi:ABC-type transport system substrate-binding protein
VRRKAYTAVERIEAPDPRTVVFKLKFPSASLLTNLASPWNVIFPLGRCSLVSEGHTANREGEIEAHYRTNPVGATRSK